MMYQYYPGCSLKGSGRAYEESLLAVFRALGAGLEEMEDWNCCGATSYMSAGEAEGVALAGRNLALAEKKPGDLLTPCAACYLAMLRTQRRMQEYPKVRQEVDRILARVGLTYHDVVRVRHPLDVLVNDVGIGAIAARVTRPLRGLKVAPYYGCQIVRPYALFDDAENPTAMDRILKAAGAEVVDFPMKTRCCGGSHTGMLPEVGLRLVHILLREARRRGADVIVAACPLCQFNLDCYQDEVASRFEQASIPVLYLTQVLGLALGLPGRALGLDRNVVPVEPALAQRRIAGV
jgi:heterodisulfide reductase subunit B